jgi:hypothetical protein
MSKKYPKDDLIKMITELTEISSEKTDNFIVLSNRLFTKIDSAKVPVD